MRLLEGHFADGDRVGWTPRGDALVLPDAGARSAPVVAGARGPAHGPRRQRGFLRQAHGYRLRAAVVAARAVLAGRGELHIDRDTR